MTRPPYGLSFPCRITRFRDGDTIEVQLSGAFTWALRLKDCWCPETRGPEREQGLAAKSFAEKCIEGNSEISLFIPLPQSWVDSCLDGEPVNPFSYLTFDRVPAVVFLTDSDTLNDTLIKYGHATKDKPKK